MHFFRRIFLKAFLYPCPVNSFLFSLFEIILFFDTFQLTFFTHSTSLKLIANFNSNCVKKGSKRVISKMTDRKPFYILMLLSLFLRLLSLMVKWCCNTFPSCFFFGLTATMIAVIVYFWPPFQLVTAFLSLPLCAAARPNCSMVRH